MQAGRIPGRISQENSSPFPTHTLEFCLLDFPTDNFYNNYRILE